MNKKIIVLDTETTGLDSNIDEILQLSIIDNEKNVLLNEYYMPQNIIEWPEAEAVNGISYEDVKDKPAIIEDKEKIQAIIDEADLIVGYNVLFDIRFLESEIDLKIGTTPIFDVMLKFANVYGQFNSNYNNYKWQKLTTCAKYYGYNWDEKGIDAHNSLGDCFATLFCYEKVKEWWDKAINIELCGSEDDIQEIISEIRDKTNLKIVEDNHENTKVYVDSLFDNTEEKDIKYTRSIKIHLK